MHGTNEKKMECLRKDIKGFKWEFLYCKISGEKKFKEGTQEQNEGGSHCNHPYY